MDDYDYEYVDDDDATLELDEISERLKRSVDLTGNREPSKSDIYPTPSSPRW